MKNGDKGDTEYDHGQWKAEVKLDKCHSRGECKSGSRKKSDCAGLSGHDRQGYTVPWKSVISKQIAFNIFCPPTLVNAINDNYEEGSKQHYPINSAHSKVLVNR
jgi:hypothetical protein